MQVTVIRRKGQAVLVEWDENGVQRSTLPASELVIADDGQTAECADPWIGIPYGDNFAGAIQLSVTAENIDRALKVAGMWTWGDIRLNPQTAISVILAAFGPIVSQLLNQATKEPNNG